MAQGLLCGQLGQQSTRIFGCRGTSAIVLWGQLALSIDREIYGESRKIVWCQFDRSVGIESVVW